MEEDKRTLGGSMRFFKRVTFCGLSDFKLLLADSDAASCSALYEAYILLYPPSSRVKYKLRRGDMQFSNIYAFHVA